MVSNARDDLPEPDSPVKTISESRGRSIETSLRLCSRAPRMMSWSATALPRDRSNMRSSSYVAPATRRPAPRRLRPRSHAPPTVRSSTVRPPAVRMDRMTPEPATAAPDLPEVVDLLQEANQRLVRGVDALHGDDWAAPSLLPGWTRSHVVAHLTLNAEALAGALDGASRGEPVPMYASQEARDADIEELAGADAADLRERLLASVTVL